MNNNDVSSIYKELRESFAVIGLTGALGSGCSTVADVLSKDIDNNFLTEFSLSCLSEHEEFDSLEKYRVLKVKDFIKDNWKKFYSIKVSNLLFTIFFASDNKEDKIKQEEITWLKDKETLSKARKISKSIVSIVLSDSNLSSNSNVLSESLKELDELIKEGVNKKDSSYTIDFQEVGNNLRQHGLLRYVDCSKVNVEDLQSVFTIADYVNSTIQNLRKEDFCFFVVDALRNLHEINYFKARFANFFLFSINAKQEERKNRILSCFGYRQKDYKEIVALETDKKNKHSQNINECISNGDVFLSNNKDKNYLTYQIVKYVSLMRKPGLFTPSKDERNMQIALTARYNSGCISRQVGACVVGKDGYILGIGWNDVPEGSVPCLYRSSRSLLLDNQGLPEFSEYETSENFKSYVRETVGINTDPFCFKDLENKRSAQENLDEIAKKYEVNNDLQLILLKEFKNPTRERALHAEENAFLQSSKVGGSSLIGGVLYTTASPCQLCAKKAMQLGISRIVYIDAYPDISNQQTLRSGRKEAQPKIDEFSGVAESAFMKLFKPIINIKDEVKSTSF